MDFATDALATYRLTRLAIKDDLTGPIRLKVRRAALGSEVQDGVAAKLETLLSCPWCASFWIGIGVVAARTFVPKAWAPLARILAFSAVTGLVAENLDK